MNNLGVALQRQGRRKQAIHYFGEASKLDPRLELPRRNAVGAARASGAGAFILALIVLFGLAIASGLWIAVIPLTALIYRFRSYLLGLVRLGFRRRPDDPVASRRLRRDLQREATPLVRVRWFALASILVVISFAVLALTLAGLEAVTTEGSLWTGLACWLWTQS